MDAEADIRRVPGPPQGENPKPEEWHARIAQHPKLVDLPHERGLKPISRYGAKMATGSGKTVVMAMLISWAFCNSGTKPGDPRFSRRALVVCPNLTIKERLVRLVQVIPTTITRSSTSCPFAATRTRQGQNAGHELALVQP